MFFSLFFLLFVLLWIGISQSNRAATPEHPYGWGAARWMWNLMSAMGIFFLGCGVTAYHGVHSLVEALHQGIRRYFAKNPPLARNRQL